MSKILIVMIYGRQRLRVRKAAIEKFLHDYSLSEEEKEILLQRPIFENGNDAFFVVLKRASEIKERCSALMQDPYCMMTATLELLETVSNEEESAYHRLFSWCQNECRLTGDKNYALDSGNLAFLRLRQGLQTLCIKESYFNHCITEFVNNRRNLLTLLLSENLTQWSEHTNENNPNQLISNIFTWIHEYLNEERTGIRLLFMKEMDDRIGGIMEKEGNHLVISCLDVIFSGANKFIQESLLPFFDKTSNLPQLFEAMQIMAFYDSIIGNTISPSCSLNSTLLSIEQTLWNSITNHLVIRVKHYFKLSPFITNTFLASTADMQNASSTKSNNVFTELLLLLKQCFEL